MNSEYLKALKDDPGSIGFVLMFSFQIFFFSYTYVLYISEKNWTVGFEIYEMYTFQCLDLFGCI